MVTRKPFIDSLDIPNSKKRILNAAITVFSKKGFAGTTTFEIAKIAEVSEGTIFRYFKTKSKLLDEVSLVFSNFVEFIINTIDDNEFNFEYSLKHLLMLAKAESDIIVVVMSEALHNPAFRCLVEKELSSVNTQKIKNLFDKLKKDKILRSDITYNEIINIVICNILLCVLSQKYFNIIPDNQKSCFDETILADIILFGIGFHNHYY